MNDDEIAGVIALRFGGREAEVIQELVNRTNHLSDEIRALRQRVFDLENENQN